MKLAQLFEQKKQNLLNIYFTAGYPNLNDTTLIIKQLAQAGVDMIEVGMPYSDPLADGATIQESGIKAITNGMTLSLLFEQLSAIRSDVKTPLILMGYFNQVMQFGEENFLAACQRAGIETVILPDLPLQVYEQDLKSLFERYHVNIVFLVTPQTSEERIRKIDALSNSFIYIVADSSITGSATGISDTQIAYFQRIKAMNLRNPTLIGFGISDRKSYQTVCEYANGAIIGSAFIKALTHGKDNVETATTHFVKTILKK
jgi:tryptophan synthase alpha chain